MGDVPNYAVARRASIAALAVCACLAAPAAQPSGVTPAPAATRTIRLHGLVEPVRSYTVSAPRLTGGTPGSVVNQLVIVRLVPPGIYVKPGDVLVEFDRSAQLKATHDRETEYRDFLEQINRKRGEQLAARALRDSQVKQAENQVRIAELGVLGNDMLARIAAEKNTQLLEEAKSHLAQLRKTVELKARAEAADMRILEIQRDRARNAWEHARRNADRMRILAPLPGLIVLKNVWKGGTMAEVQEGEEVRAGIPILDVVDPSAMRVRAKVNQADVEYLTVGQPARLTLDSYTGRQFHGRLEHLSPIAGTSSLSNRVRTFIAVFSIDGTDEHLLPDLAVAIDIAVAGGTSQAAAP